MGSDEQSAPSEVPGGSRDSLIDTAPGPAERVPVEGRVRVRERSAIATLVTLVALASPLRFLWAAPARPWWLVFVLWAGAVGLGVWLARPSVAGDRES